MCDAVVVPSKSENEKEMNRVLAPVSTVTSPKPVPGDAFGGTSERPLRSAKYVIWPAKAVDAKRTTAPKNSRKTLMFIPPSGWIVWTSICYREASIKFSVHSCRGK